jgi:AbrB family looped-hinge helix DNA binding protein
MAEPYLTVSSKGQIVIPAHVREVLGIKAGTRVLYRREGMELVLRPETEMTAQVLIQQLCGMTAVGPSMSDDLVAERRAEDQKADW